MKYRKGKQTNKKLSGYLLWVGGSENGCFCIPRCVIFTCEPGELYPFTTKNKGRVCKIAFQSAQTSIISRLDAWLQPQPPK